MDITSDPERRRCKRVSKACDRCRRKKDKCDGLRPTCSRCHLLGRNCSYDPSVKKRGLPGGYVKGLEKLLALSICNIDGLEDDVLALLGASDSTQIRKKHLKKFWADDNASGMLHRSWKSSRLYPAFMSIHDPKRGPVNTPNDVDIESNSDVLLDSSHLVEPSSSPNGSEKPSSAKNTPSAPRLPPQTAELVNTYFATTHPWLPILSKRETLRICHLFTNTTLSVAKTVTGSEDQAVLWALLSYTVSQIQNDLPGGANKALEKTKEYYAIARSMIPAETEHFALGHVQALLLLALVKTGLGEWTAAWLLSGQAARMAISMGLADSNMANRSSHEEGKPVVLGCFVIDTLISFRLSRRPCMHPSDLKAVGLLEEQGMEELTPWSDVLPLPQLSQVMKPPRQGPIVSYSCFNRLVELAGLLNKIARDNSSGNILPLAQQLVAELKQWDNRLPLGCRLSGPESIYPERHSALLPHQTYLGLTYIATLLWLFVLIVPSERELHASQSPALEGAKKLLYRVLPLISRHLENFRACGIPPIFEFSLHTITERAFTLYNMNPSALDSFPLGRWLDALLQRMMELNSTWPVYNTLRTTIIYWCRSKSGTTPLKTAKSPQPSSVSSNYDTPGLFQMAQPNLKVATPRRSSQQYPYTPESDSDSLYIPATTTGSSGHYTIPADNMLGNDIFTTPAPSEGSSASLPPAYNGLVALHSHPYVSDFSFPNTMSLARNQGIEEVFQSTGTPSMNGSCIGTDDSSYLDY